MTKVSETHTKEFTPVSELINHACLSQFYNENEVYINAGSEYGPFSYYVTARSVTRSNLINLKNKMKRSSNSGAYPENFEGGPLSEFSNFFFEIFDKT